MIRTITVLVIACPHALGLAIPLVVSIATERAARGGVLVKDRLALESMRTVSAVLFDKTGTLTKGEPTVTPRWPRRTAAPRTNVLALAAAAESDSEHPLARAIVDGRAPAADVDGAAVVGLHLVTGRRRDGDRRTAGPCGSAGRACSTRPAQVELPESQRWHDEGAIVLHVLVDGVGACGALALADEVRDESRQAVDALHRLGIEVVMITGDARDRGRVGRARSSASTGCSPGCGPRTRRPRSANCRPRD